MSKLESLKSALEAVFGERVRCLEANDEITLEVPVGSLLDVMRTLRDDEQLRFDTAIDLCGVDYSTYGEGAWSGARFASVVHLLSVVKYRQLLSTPHRCLVLSSPHRCLVH